MGGRLWKREQHTRRIVLYRLKHHVQPRFGYSKYLGSLPEWPQSCWQDIGFFKDHRDAHWVASQHPGSRLEPVYHRRGKRPLLGYRVGFIIRSGAPFRTPVMTWEMEEERQAYEQVEVRRWMKRGSLKGGLAQCTRPIRRRWRYAGKKACLLAMQGDFDGVDALHPQPERLGVMWILW